MHTDRNRDDRELAGLLQELKERDGRSYTAIAHRTGLSRSSVHRYCQGLTVPTSFGAVERIARVCGVGKEELDGLYRAWVRAGEGASAEREDATPSQPPVRDEDLEPDREPLPGAAADHPGSRPRSRFRARRSRLFLAVLAALGVIAATVIGVVSRSGAPVGDQVAGPSGGQDSGTDPELVGPHWSMAPKRLDSEYIGVTMNSDTGEMPGFDVGGVRFWESETRWGQIEPKRDTYDFATLDRLANGAERAGLPALFVFGGTPGWAVPPDTPKTPYGDDTRTAPPTDLDDWENFVDKVATRYRGRIDAYELWDNVGASTHYSGDMKTLVEMVRRASAAIRAADPDAVVACPSFGRLWEREGQRLLAEFAHLGGYTYCEAAPVKLHPRRGGGKPEEMIELASKVKNILYREDEGPPLWNTGPGKEIALTPPLSARRAQDYAVRFYLAGLYSIKHEQVRRMYFYSWGSTGVPLVVEPVGGAPTEAGRRIGRLHRWLANARITSCGRGPDVGLPEGGYECRFLGEGDERLSVLWLEQGRTDIEAPGGARLLRRMDGSTQRIAPGERVAFDETPVLIESAAQDDS
ncbi:helix-turn-helix domain-containing protein [Streptomyces sp. NPDC057696]|uniref:helix-turn-helix domain-containing protein n=1 Tax=unclassified Streptomyces TaxID=2593676 RepID=UPI0036B838F7